MAQYVVYVDLEKETGDTAYEDEMMTEELIVEAESADDAVDMAYKKIKKEKLFQDYEGIYLWDVLEDDVIE